MAPWPLLEPFRNANSERVRWRLLVAPQPILEHSLDKDSIGNYSGVAGGTPANSGAGGRWAPALSATFPR